MIQSRVHVSDLREHVGRTVTVFGWVNTLRLQSKMQFVVVRDGTGMVQVTHKRDNGPLEARLQALTPESAFKITGRVTDAAQVKLGGLEIVPETVEVPNPVATPLPIDEQTGIEHRLDWRFLDVRRRPAAQLMFAVQTTLEQGLREYAYAQGATEMHTPKLMGTASESGAEVFELGYFGRSAYLAQSPQFYKQMAISAGIEKVFEIGPVFRAEPSFTSRHATEFTGVDVELAWIDGIDDVMAFEERMLTPAIAKVADTHGEAVRERFCVEITVPTTPFPRITMAEAHEILRKGGWTPEGIKEDLGPEGERRISAHIQQATGHEFVFITHYPVSSRPFYHMRPADDPSVTLSFDLLWKGLEITTGAQREHRYDVLLKQAAEKGMSPEPMQDYLNAFRYGCPPHGGLGMGLGRVLMVMLGLESIREATFLFRGPNRLTP
ncbi:aspartyl-tRNA synthetase [Streptomyces puniciscabiei]|uniref:Aspartate--tRNA ligase n=1 Tax=Streptomyces puniciscabiei TaxID=164348 RepID=A0A542UEP8_9ACTN|nr:aspartate--tRNA(Asn) ligase [Streptomyces puniciscabiei]TQK97541.1 aspartyl-tRNA synthetase [Streptomyces puniciscabiei]